MPEETGYTNPRVYDTERPVAEPSINWDVVIQQCTGRGFIVKVGCKQFAFETKDSMIARITQYLSDPQATEKAYNEGTLFNQ